MKDSRYKKGSEIDSFTKSLFKLVLEIAKAAELNSKDYFFGGGMAIDLHFGKITRNHHDIDFHPILKDYSWWKQWFIKKGYSIEEPASEDFPETSHVIDNEGNMLVDLWPMRLVSNRLKIKHKGSYSDAGRHWNEIQTVKFMGNNIKIENPERVLDQKKRHFKSGEEFREQDKHDYELLGRKTDFTKSK